ncbi:NAD(+) synthase [Bosea sp. TND4EK4]|uniref:NAD(+) synthase n=1 Tax=Bosea sp. TND4EK4 TaxID=1907408 RepID=UPI000953FF40|nr:NAD(+) synthase [Bosea sp. TND4EK4]SIQ86309.1 NAD+ synthase (glutamine-hydrolysing) [Bosea sp. TND4EK4]
MGFRNIHEHGLVRVACAAPRVKVADPAFNTQRTLAMLQKADEAGASLCLFPELGISAYAIDDLLLQNPLLDAVKAGLARLVEESRTLACVAVVGAPLRVEGRLFNCAVAIHRGRILAAVPKTFLPNYREFYERRQFAPGERAGALTIELCGQDVPFGTDILLSATDLPDFVVHMEICEDVWTPIPPSSYGALAGATVLLNLSASNVTIGKSEWRHALCKAHSGRCIAAYAYSAAGTGESTTDLAWDGQAMIYENGALLAEAERFAEDPELILADIDLERLVMDRIRQNTFGDSIDAHREKLAFRRVGFELNPDRGSDLGLARAVERFPFVPSDDARLNELCFEAYNIQSHGLRQRLASTKLEKVVIGVSGGLDSTQALLVAAHTFDALGLPRQNILAYTLPAFATSKGTKDQAWRLMRALGVSAEEIDMTPACRQMLVDIGHPFAKGEPLYDITFENVQAGARTSVLFRLANKHNALVMGTGDLSELALGWCTYGVGDQMSHYNVNGSVPKTLIQHLIRWVAQSGRVGEEASDVLLDILGTEISPELVPGEGDEPAQKTEDFVGPYALQDFNLYYTTRYGFRPGKIAFLAEKAWGDAEVGTWPPHMEEARRLAYELPVIKRWLGVFIRRFFETSQFKRSAMPNGPKVSSGGSLSPRGDWRAPSDASAAAWLADWQRIPD